MLPCIYFPLLIYFSFPEELLKMQLDMGFPNRRGRPYSQLRNPPKRVFVCDRCNKAYRYRQGLHEHKKYRCNATPRNSDSTINLDTFAGDQQNSLGFL